METTLDSQKRIAWAGEVGLAIRLHMLLIIVIIV